MYDELVPIALDFMRRLVASLDAGDHRAFERTITALIERSTELAAELGSKD